MSPSTTAHQTMPELSPQQQAEIRLLLERRKKVTINDVARLAEVSKKTISRIINDAPNVNEETRQKVQRIIALLGYKPDPQARGLAFRRSFLIGLVYDNPNAYYVVKMQRGILDQIHGTGHELVVHPCEPNDPDIASNVRDFIERQKLMGVVLLPPLAEKRELIALIQDLDVPLVRITARPGVRNDPPINTAQVVSLDRIGCEEAAAHLLRLGHCQIGFIAGNPIYPSAHERRAGFEAGLEAHGLKIEPEFEAQGDYTFESGYEAGLQLLHRKRRPTAIMCSNDEMAAGAYKAAHELGISIPRELSIVSFDDSDLAQKLTPGLTTVRLPTRQMAAQAAQILLNWDDKQPQSMTFESRLIIRGSSALVSVESAQ